MLLRQPVEFRDLDKNHMERGELFSKHFYKNIQIDTAGIANFHFSIFQWKLHVIDIQLGPVVQN